MGADPVSHIAMSVGYGMIMIVIVLYIAAGVFEALGLVLAAVGFKRTWVEFGTGEALQVAVFRPVAQRASAGTAWVEQRVRQLLRRPKNVTVHVGAATLSIGMTSRATVRVTYGPLPTLSEDPDAFAEEVHRRIQEVHEQTQRAHEAIGDESRVRDEAVQALSSDLDAKTKEIEQLSKTVAVGGLVEQIYGWLFISAGVALGTLGNVIQAAQSS